jgi:hypothetical protein
MPSIHLHTRQLLLIARDAVIRSRADAQRPAALTADSILSILLSAASTEAFINEFAAYASPVYGGIDDGEPGPAGIAIARCADVIRELEDSRAPVYEKYVAAAEVLGHAFSTGAAPYQDFRQLIDLRNGIMHMKGALDGEKHSALKATDALGQRGIAIPSAGPLGSLAWFDRLMTPAVALWAHDSALAMIIGFLARVPVREYYDPLGNYRRSFQEHPSAR